MYMPNNMGNAPCALVFEVLHRYAKLCTNAHHLRWNADQSSEKLSNRYSLKHCLHYYLEIAVTAGKVPVFHFRHFRESFRDQAIYKICQIRPNLHGLCREESKGVTPKPLSQQGWTVDISNGQSLVLGRDCVRWEVLNCSGTVIRRD